MSLIKKIKKHLAGSNGVVAVIVALLITGIIGMTALVVDMGSLYEDRRSLQGVADAAALAGVQELNGQYESTFSARQEAEKNILENYKDDNSVDISFGSFGGVDYTEIKVTVSNPDSPLYFGRIYGSDSENVSATATAIVATPMSIGNVVPWAAHLKEGEELSDWIDTMTELILKYGAGSSIEGNFYALDLDTINKDKPSGSGGANEYYNYIVEGYPGRIKKYDTVWTKPGVMGKTGKKVEERLEFYGGDGNPEGFWELVDYDDDGKLTLDVYSGQLIYVPVIRELENPTGRDRVTILAIAPFIITDFTTKGQGFVKGKFIEKALIVDDTNDLVGMDSSGFRVIRLIK